MAQDRKRGSQPATDVDETYDVTGITTPDKVPNWARQKRKWEDIVQKVSQLRPNQTLTIHFKSAAAAERARTTVRTAINEAAMLPVLATRLVPDDAGEGANVFFSRLSDEEAKKRQKE